jgi:hypothetical protein
MLVLPAYTSKGQVQILAESFAGFTTGSHATPSTSDASSSLDSRTSVPGWTGSLIYPAGGEVKIGTGSNTGWIQTPSLDLSSSGGLFTIEFDISRWPGDATSIQLYIDENPIGDVIIPTDNFQRIHTSGSLGTSASKIKFVALTKRFYLDNVTITSGSVSTTIAMTENRATVVNLYPVPASNYLTISNLQLFQIIDIQDITGRHIEHLHNPGEDIKTIDISAYPPGIYLITLRSATISVCRKFVKK